MKNLGLIIGIASAAAGFIAFVPCLGWLNWLIIPLAVIGLIISIMGVSDNRDSNKTAAIVGIVLCAFAIVFGILRLWAGGGVI